MQNSHISITDPYQITASTDMEAQCAPSHSIKLSSEEFGMYSRIVK